MKIITLTLNPAFDVHCFCEQFKPYHESVVKMISKDAGGKGVNISRALTINGTDNVAVVLVGRENGEEFCKALKKDGMCVSAVWVDGRIRENITLHEEKNPETRISFDGFFCQKAVLNQVMQCVGEIDENTIITFTGSIPNGITTQDVLQLLRDFRNRGAKIVVDSRSVSMAELIDFKPWLIKPNKDEAEGYASKSIQTIDDAVEIAQTFQKNGVENVIISLGGDGAVWACKDGTMVGQSPKVNVLSTIGAGDSMLAGFIDGTAKGLNPLEILKRAIAYGTAACMQEGTLPPQKQDIQALESGICCRAYTR
jgi:1-phosphofructokinase family hexose kinase